jgi:hypothetical protein
MTTWRLGMRMLVAAAALVLVTPTLVPVTPIGLWTGAVLAGESIPQSEDHSQTGASDTDKHRGNQECPIKKTINGMTYCFQNDPALTKRQGGGD